jgi:DNA-binding MarR family transcriptional regulator
VQAPAGAGDEGPSPQLAVLQKFREIYRAAKVHFRAAESAVGVSGAQLWTLCELSEHPGMRVKDLAAAMALHQSTVSNLLEALEKMGLIERRRSEEDQRVVRVFITRAGAAKVGAAPGPARGVLPEALASLPPASLRRLDRELGTLLEHMQVKPGKGAFTPLSDI